MIDRTQIMYEFLTASSPLADQVSTRVWSPIAHSSWKTGQAAIVFDQPTSGSHITASTNTATFSFKCYGADKKYKSARTIYRLLYDRLQMASETVAGGQIIMAKLVFDSQLPPEPDNKYKAHLAQFSIQFEG